MRIPDIINKMRAKNILEEDIQAIVKKFRKSNFSEEDIDNELLRLGYEKIFTADFENFDDYEDYYDDLEDNDEYIVRKKNYYKDYSNDD